ncbi:hypothetical protein Veis_0845 [Verminephrobacter eiseniae EF01-2]|uniref:Uncharacterized protein n=2 Tax=Verminephrobacter eiseniae TaxID=364317 RepID=A1WG68_VEREI|nr:hypothetical protein Veis_0845 [Verminephrobacter eiseniae EF01-2]
MRIMQIHVGIHQRHGAVPTLRRAKAETMAAQRGADPGAAWVSEPANARACGKKDGRWPAWAVRPTRPGAARRVHRLTGRAIDDLFDAGHWIPGLGANDRG